MIILRQKEYSIFNKLKSWGENYNRSRGVLPESEVLANDLNRVRAERENEDLKKYKDFGDLSEKHKEALNIYNQLKNHYPGLGDGDEYADFNVNVQDGTISSGIQNPRYYLKNGSWYNKDTGRVVPNIKKELTGYIDSDISEYKKDSYGWGKEDSEKVVKYLEKQKQLINNSKI